MNVDNEDLEALWDATVADSRSLNQHPLKCLEVVLQVAMREGLWDYATCLRIRTFIARRGLSRHEEFPYPEDSWRYWLSN